MSGVHDAPVLDRDRLDAIAGGSSDLVRELLALFIDEASVIVAEMLSDAPAPDGARSGDLLHALKGIAGNAGAVRLQRAAEAAETADLRDAETRRDWVARFDEELAALGALR